MSQLRATPTQLLTQTAVLGCQTGKGCEASYKDSKKSESIVDGKTTTHIQTTDLSCQSGSSCNASAYKLDSTKTQNADGTTSRDYSEFGVQCEGGKCNGSIATDELDDLEEMVDNIRDFDINDLVEIPNGIEKEELNQLTASLTSDEASGFIQFVKDNPLATAGGAAGGAAALLGAYYAISGRRRKKEMEELLSVAEGECATDTESSDATEDDITTDTTIDLEGLEGTQEASSNDGLEGGMEKEEIGGNNVGEDITKPELTIIGGDTRTCTPEEVERELISENFYPDFFVQENVDLMQDYYYATTEQQARELLKNMQLKDPENAELYQQRLDEAISAWHSLPSYEEQMKKFGKPSEKLMEEFYGNKEPSIGEIEDEIYSVDEMNQNDFIELDNMLNEFYIEDNPKNTDKNLEFGVRQSAFVGTAKVDLIGDSNTYQSNNKKIKGEVYKVLRDSQYNKKKGWPLPKLKDFNKLKNTIIKNKKLKPSEKKILIRKVNLYINKIIAKSAKTIHKTASVKKINKYLRKKGYSVTAYENANGQLKLLRANINIPAGALSELQESTKEKIAEINTEIEQVKGKLSTDKDGYLGEVKKVDSTIKSFFKTDSNGNVDLSEIKEKTPFEAVRWIATKIAPFFDDSLERGKGESYWNHMERIKPFLDNRVAMYLNQNNIKKENGKYVFPIEKLREVFFENVNKSINVYEIKINKAKKDNEKQKYRAKKQELEDFKKTKENITEKEKKVKKLQDEKEELEKQKDYTKTNVTIEKVAQELGVDNNILKAICRQEVLTEDIYKNGGFNGAGDINLRMETANMIDRLKLLGEANISTELKKYLLDPTFKEAKTKKLKKNKKNLVQNVIFKIKVSWKSLKNRKLVHQI